MIVNNQVRWMYENVFRMKLLSHTKNVGTEWPSFLAISWSSRNIHVPCGRILRSRQWQRQWSFWSVPGKHRDRCFLAICSLDAQINTYMDLLGRGREFRMIKQGSVGHCLAAQCFLKCYSEMFCLDILKKSSVKNQAKKNLRSFFNLFEPELPRL